MPRQFVIQQKPVFFLALAFITFYAGQLSTQAWAEPSSTATAPPSQIFPAESEQPAQGSYEAFLQKHPVAAQFLKNHPKAAEKVKNRLEQREQNCNKAQTEAAQ